MNSTNCGTPNSTSTLLGFTAEELNDLIGTPRIGPAADPDVIPELITDAPAVTACGDVWMLGKHRLMCGDAIEAEDVATLMAGKVAHMMHADPPYGMGKEADGVANDNLYGSKLDAFQMAWWQAFRPNLHDNASAYVWGNAPDLWRLWYWAGLGDSEPLTMRNEIVWDKANIAGMASPDLTQYPEATERCLFFQIGRHVLLVNQTMADYWQGWEPIRAWMCAQRDAMGWKASDIRRICGNHMHGHWFGTSQWCIISADNYRKLQAAAEGRAFTRDYANLQAEYHEALSEFNVEIRGPRREEFNADRPYFDNAHEVMRDVWEYGRVYGEDRYGHATPKPVAMMERAIRSSTRHGELVIDPFCGTGSTLIGAESAGRICFTMELQPSYVDIAVKRWQQFTGKAATLEGDGGASRRSATSANRWR